MLWNAQLIKVYFRYVLYNIKSVTGKNILTCIGCRNFRSIKRLGEGFLFRLFMFGRYNFVGFLIIRLMFLFLIRLLSIFRNSWSLILLLDILPLVLGVISFVLIVALDSSSSLIMTDIWILAPVILLWSCRMIIYWLRVITRLFLVVIVVVGGVRITFLRWILHSKLAFLVVALTRGRLCNIVILLRIPWVSHTPFDKTCFY